MRERKYSSNKNYAPELLAFGVIAVVIQLLSAMERTHTGRTSYLIRVSPKPGKYEDENRTGFERLKITIAYRDKAGDGKTPLATRKYGTSEQIFIHS